MDIPPFTHCVNAFVVGAQRGQFDEIPLAQSVTEAEDLSAG